MHKAHANFTTWKMHRMTGVIQQPMQATPLCYHHHAVHGMDCKHIRLQVRKHIEAKICAAMQDWLPRTLIHFVQTYLKR